MRRARKLYIRWFSRCRLTLCQIRHIVQIRMSPQDKPLAWLHGEVKTPPFSKAARIDAGYLLRQLQQGQTLPALSLRSSCGVSRKLAPELATKAMTKRGPSRLDLPEQLAKAIRQAWPS